MFSTDFELKKIPGTEEGHEYFVITEANGYTIGVRPILGSDFSGSVNLGFRIRVVGDNPEDAADELGIPLAAKSEKHASNTVYVSLGSLAQLALHRALEIIEDQKLIRKISGEVLSKLKDTVPITEKEFIASEALLTIVDEMKMSLKKSEEGTNDFPVKFGKV